MSYSPANIFWTDPADPASGARLDSLEGNGQLSGPTIAKAYGIPPATGLGVKIGIWSDGGGFLQSDLDKSFADLQQAGLLSRELTPPQIKQVLAKSRDGVFDPNNPDGASRENTMDIFCVATMVPEASITLYMVGNFGDMLAQAIDDGIHIITISWATFESRNSPEDIWFERAAAAKITVLAASGDWGSTITQTNPALQLCYPAAHPDVIAVGGTKLILDANNNRLSESDDNRDPNFPSGWGGGGGVSYVHSLPSWQSGLRYSKITNNGLSVTRTNLTMRGSPDFSAPMNVYYLYYNGQPAGVGGTSCSAPIMAGILARYQQLTGVHRSSADWNKIAYANPSAFYDITVGTNNTVISIGYAGTIGWDPVTGLGPPIGTELYKLVRTGGVFPKQNYGFRPPTGSVYPRSIPSRAKTL
jgi:subtilase family serine protease